MNNQKGYIKLVLVIFAIIIGLLIFPLKFPKPVPATGCVVGEAPETYEEIKGLPGVSEIDLPPEIAEHGGGPDPATSADYVLIRKKVPADSYAMGHIRPISSPQPKEGYTLAYPSSDGGKSISKPEGRLDLRTRHEGLIYFINNDPSTIRKARILNRRPTAAPDTMIDDSIYEVDVYQDKRVFEDKTRDYKPEELFTCGAEAAISSTGVVVPDQTKSQTRDQLQLEWFLMQRNGVWGLHCKPAIYLYPPEKMMVNVKVHPSGFLTYTDPPYDSNKGWTVWAGPNGDLYQLSTINYQGKSKYDYLYFESKISDEVIKKPTKGWVVKYDQLENLYQNILPKLGLNEQQKNDFIEYWTKALSKNRSPYYFVGVIDQDNVDQIERLEITPKPDSVNRVRIYFERLDTPKTVEAPELSAISNQTSANSEKAESRKLTTESQFNVVEWGGMVKNDKDHPFTCSQ